MNCGTCKFMDVVIADECEECDAPPTPLTICRRNPPNAEGWPLVMNEDWCGEWAA